MLRASVVVSLALLVGGKVLNIQVPFLFKHIVDTLSVAGEPLQVAASAASAAAGVDPVLATAAVVVPASLLIGYGMARATAEGFNQLRNAVFATVAQRAIRLVSKDVFR